MKLITDIIEVRGSSICMKQPCNSRKKLGSNGRNQQISGEMKENDGRDRRNRVCRSLLESRRGDIISAKVIAADELFGKPTFDYGCLITGTWSRDRPTDVISRRPARLHSLKE